MSVTEVCRLCPETTNLLHVFDERISRTDNMKELVYIITGIEIHEKDIVSQQICARCCNITLKMFKFRQDALKHDKALKEKCCQLLKETSIKIPHTNVTIKQENHRKPIKKESSIRKDTPHPSVTQLYRRYPNLKLPQVCLTSHLTPFVTLKMGEVEKYFKSRKLDMKKFIQQPPVFNKLAKKKTSSNNKFTSREKQKKNCENKVIDKPEIKENVDSVSNDVNTRLNVQIQEPRKRKHSEIDGKVPDSKKQKHLKTGRSTPENRKEKIDKADSKISNTKPVFVESIGLTPTKPIPTANNDSPSTLSVIDKFVPLHICDICNSVQYSAKDLKRHQYKHLVCQFCKEKFRNLASKTTHIENNCIIKLTMNNLPDVELGKVELDIQVRQKYPEAFLDFSALSGMNVDLPSSLNCTDLTEGISSSLRNDNDFNVTVTEANKISAVDSHVTSCKSLNTDVIEILSDEEDDKLRHEDKEPLNDFTKDCREVKSFIPTPPDSRVDVNSPASVSSNIVPIQENIIYNTVSIVKPDIKIKNNDVLSKIDHKATELKVIRDLLCYVKPPKTARDRMLQTDSPTNKDIKINRSDMTCELKSLKSHLTVYKIPVVIKNGPFSVSFNYQSITKSQKKMCFWNDLPVIDINSFNTKDTLNQSTNIVQPPLPQEVNIQTTQASQTIPTITATPVVISNNQTITPQTVMDNNMQQNFPPTSAHNSLVMYNPPSNNDNSSSFHSSIDRPTGCVTANTINNNVNTSIMESNKTHHLQDSSASVPCSNTAFLENVSQPIRVKNVWELQ